MNRKTSIKELSLCALLTGLLILSSLIALPLPGTRITLQFSVLLLIGGLLPPVKGLLCVACYLTLGALGLPVFAGFSGGSGVLFGATGGFLFGFLAAVLTQSLLLKAAKKKSLLSNVLCALAALAACYLCGLWGFLLYTPHTDLARAAALCLLPCILPDLLKILLSCLLLQRIKVIQKSAD